MHKIPGEPQQDCQASSARRHAFRHAESMPVAERYNQMADLGVQVQAQSFAGSTTLFVLEKFFNDSSKH